MTSQMFHLKLCLMTSPLGQLNINAYWCHRPSMQWHYHNIINWNISSRAEFRNFAETARPYMDWQDCHWQNLFIARFGANRGNRHERPNQRNHSSVVSSWHNSFPSLDKILLDYAQTRYWMSSLTVKRWPVVPETYWKIKNVAMVCWYLNVDQFLFLVIDLLLLIT